MKSKLPEQIYDEIYRQNIYIFLGWDFVDVNKYLKHRFKLMDEVPFSPKDGTTFEFEYQDIKMMGVWLKDKSLPTLVHELFHAVCFTFRNKGIILDDNSDEAFAYYLEYLVTKSINLLKIKIL